MYARTLEKSKKGNERRKKILEESHYMMMTIKYLKICNKKHVMQLIFLACFFCSNSIVALFKHIPKKTLIHLSQKYLQPQKYYDKKSREAMQRFEMKEFFDSDENTLLHKSICEGDWEKIKFYSDKYGAYRVNSLGMTAFHMVALCNDPLVCDNLVTQLLMNGHDINAQDKSGKTPLCWAALFGKKDIACCLLRRHANLFASLKSPKDWAQENRHDEVAKLFEIIQKIEDDPFLYPGDIEGYTLEIAEILAARHAKRKKDEHKTLLEAEEMHEGLKTRILSALAITAGLSVVSLILVAKISESKK